MHRNSRAKILVQGRKAKLSHAAESNDDCGCLETCNPEAITFSCKLPPKHLKCLDLNKMLTAGGEVVDPSRLNSALGENKQILACVKTTCTRICDEEPQAPLASPICSITHTDSVVTFNFGTYTIVRTFVVTDACNNSASITQTVTFTANDSSTPLVITLTPIPVNQYCPVVEDLVPQVTCDCIFIGCDVEDEDIEAAFGEATVDRCATITHKDSAVTINGCYNEKTRTWTATDECANRVTVCRTVRWGDDTPKPIISFPLNCNLKIELMKCNPSDVEIDSYFCVPTTDHCAHLDHRDELSGHCCIRTKTRIWTAVDICGNHADPVSQSVTRHPRRQLQGGRARHRRRGRRHDHQHR